MRRSCTVSGGGVKMGLGVGVGMGGWVGEWVGGSVGWGAAGSFGRSVDRSGSFIGGGPPCGREGGGSLPHWLPPTRARDGPTTAPVGSDNGFTFDRLSANPDRGCYDLVSSRMVTAILGSRPH